MAADKGAIVAENKRSGPASPARVIISKRLVAVNSISSLLARVFNVTVLLWMYSYLLARLPPEEYAIYPVVASVMAAAPFFSFLLTGGIARFVTAAYARGDREEVTRIVSSIFPLLAGGGIVFFLGSVLFAWQMGWLLNIPADELADAQLMLVLLAGAFALQTAATAHSLGFFVLQKFVQLNLLYILRDVLRTCLLFILLLGVSTRVLWVVVANAVATAVFTFIIARLSRNMLPELRFRMQHFDWPRARRLVSFGMWTTLGQFASLINNSAGILILNGFGTAVDVTCYQLGSVFDRQIRVTSGMVTGPLEPVLTAMHSTGDRRRLGNTFVRGGRYALWASLMLGVPLSIFGEEFIRLYVGNTYLQAGLVIALISATYPFRYSDALLPKIATATARIRGFFAGAVVAQLITVLLMVYFAAVLHTGVVGVAAAMAISYALSHMLYFWPLALRMTGISFGRFAHETLLLGLLPAFVGGVVWGALKLWHPPSTWLELAVYGSVGLVAYLGTLFLFCLRQNERRDVGNILIRLRSWRHKAAA